MNSRKMLTRLLGAGVAFASLTLVAPEAGARSLLEAGSATVWKYSDADVDPDPAWVQATFDDHAWKSGPAPLGFGETRLKTTLGEGAKNRPVTAWFRHEFDAPDGKSGETLAILMCLDDGAIVYLNGHELRRINMPAGAVTHATLASHEIPNSSEGFYLRLLVPPELVVPGQKNLLAVEIHNAAISSDDLFFDLALKTVPAQLAAPPVTPSALEVVHLFNHQHFIGPGVTIPDGYIDGGRGMRLDATNHASSGREILTVDRQQDHELDKDLTFARSPELRALPVLERVQRLATRIAEETTPPGGLHWVGEATEQLQYAYAGKPLRIGDWIDQCQAGVCRHRSLLFKILADEAGLQVALVRGNFAPKADGPGFGHAWNEVTLSDGKRLLVDVMHHGGKPVFPELTDPEVITHYLRVDNTPWYGPLAKAPTTPPKAAPVPAP